MESKWETRRMKKSNQGMKKRERGLKEAREGEKESGAKSRVEIMTTSYVDEVVNRSGRTTHLHDAEPRGVKLHELETKKKKKVNQGEQ